MRNNPGPATRHIKRMCRTCKFLKDELTESGGGHVIVSHCWYPSRGNIPGCSHRPAVQLDWGKKCPLWQPIQSQVKEARHDG